MRIGKQVYRVAGDEPERIDREPEERMEGEAQTNAAETRGSSTGTMKSTQSALRTLGDVASNIRTASGIATAIVAKTVITSHSTDTQTESRKGGSLNSARKNWRSRHKRRRDC